MRVLVADKLPEISIEKMIADDFTIHAEPSLNGEALTKAIAEFKPDALVVRSTRVEEEHIHAASSLCLVIRGGAGVNTIDLKTCARRGVYVANCPGKNAIAVAELTMGLLLGLDRRIPDNVAELRAGQWNKALYSKARGLKGRTLGLLGLGRIGSAVAQRALAFDMVVVAWDKFVTPQDAEALGVKLCDTPEEVAAQCDALSVHVALVDETRGLVSQSVLAALKPGAFFINTSRDAVVDEDALIAAMDEKGIRAAVDVMAGEPKAKKGPINARLASHANVYGTHHIGASTAQAQEAVADEIHKILSTGRATGRILNCVNLAERTSANFLLVVRHKDKVGVLAGVLDALRTAEINVEEMDNTIFMGGEAATAHIQIHGRPSGDVLEKMRTNDDIFAVVVTALE